MANFCGKCGSELKENEKFCSKCGARIEREILTPDTYREVNYDTPINDDSQTKKKGKKMNKGKKVKVILITAAAVFLALLITLTALFFTGSSYGVYRDMQAQEYNEAVSDYTSVVKNNLIQKLFLKIVLSNYDEKVIEKFENGKMEYDSAVDALKALQEMGFGDMSEAINKITLIYEENTAFQQGNKYYENGDYENAIKAYSKISESNENYQEAQTKLNALYPKYISFVTENVASFLSNGDYENALSLVNTALQILPDSVDTIELVSLKNESLNNYKSKVMSDVTSLVNQNQFIDALDLINHAISVDNNDDFQNTKTTVEKKYVESVTATVQKHLDSEDYISASRTVTGALDILPENADLKALKEKVEKATPTYLLDVCKPYQVSEYYYKEYINGETFNMGGKSFTNGFTIDTSWNSFSYAIFNLENNYNKLSFYTGHVDNTRGGNGTIKIYLDGILAKEIEANDQALPQKIEIDVTGVKQLKFEVTYAGGEYGFGNVTVK